jgi:glycosyltransferase involved in cell wall biosynthesis
LRGRTFDVVFYAPWIGPVLAPGSGPPPGGAETQMAMLGRQLARRGYRVCFVVLDTSGGVPPEVDGIAIRAIRPASRRMLALRCVTAVARTRARVVVQRAASAETGLIGLVARLCGRRFVYSSANVIDFNYERLETRRRNVWLFKLGVRLASTIVVQTEEQVALCRRSFGRRPVLIKSIAEALPAAEGVPDAFLWIGRLAHYKRPEDLLRLAAALPDARFRMLCAPSAGLERDIEAKLRAEARALGNVEWLEARPREQVLQLMSSAVAIVNTAEYEGMPNIFLEGWARGIPALSLYHDPDGTIEREQIGAFAAGDFDRFVAAARELWDTRSDQAATSARCRAYIASHHDPDLVVERWVDALRLA